ncbi:hypothetical protein KC963_01980 [Candidatus Saccharibacteria bacterium]|nr:hypothetical protein [Candidatus Saccharibacteria bacterium]
MSIPSALIHNEESAARLAQKLGFDKGIEDIVNSITEASQEMLTKTGRTLAEAAIPEGMLELHRVWRDVDAVMGPGKSALQVMLTRYPRLQDTAERMTRYLRKGLQARTEVTRKLWLDAMDSELKTFSRLKSEVAKSMEQSVIPIKKKLEAKLGDEAFRLLVTLSPEEVKQECQSALNELERVIQHQRKALSKGVDARPSTAMLEARAKALVTKFEATKHSGERSVMATRIRRLTEFGDPQKLGMEFAKKVKRRITGTLPALGEIEDSAIIFMEALGVAASARPDGARLLRRYVEHGPGSLKPAELERISGYLGQLWGLLPEEIGTRMKFLDSIFHKAAFEVLADFPPPLRGQMGVEIIEGPLWVIDHTGAARQFGDGSMLLKGPNGQAAIIGLGEFKAGFDKNLLQQLFVRSDGRAVNATITFIGADGKEQIRTLTREFAFDNGKKVALTKPPIYVYGRPTGETAKTAAQFKDMVNREMQSGRELWKLQLPFDTKSNERFVNESIKEAVKTLINARKSWGR